MNPLLVSGFGTQINIEKRKLVIQNRLKDEKLEFYPHKIDHDSIIVDGHTGIISFESMRWLLKHDISLAILNWNGNLLGITLPESPKSGKLRIKQYEKYLDSESRFEIALAIVNSKAANSLNLISELSRFYDLINYDMVQRQFSTEFDNYISKLEPKINSTIKNDSISGKLSTLMNYEGRIALVYLDQFRKIVSKLAPEFNFTGRMNKSYSWNMNSADEINALLNYGYAVLESEIKKCINSVGFDPSIGYLHEIAQSKTPLVYDIQELFRWIIDYSVIQLLENKPNLKKSDFILTENYHIRLKEHTAKLLIDKIKTNFNKKAPYKGKNYSYQSILFDNVQKLANYIHGKNKRIEFFVPKMVIERDDSLELIKKVLKMTPDERKNRRINKSTLWYMKNNIKNNKRIKLYDKTASKIKANFT